MGNKYEWGTKEIQDMLMQVLSAGADISRKEMKTSINEIISQYLQYYLKNDRDIVYLDFNIRKNDTYYKVVGNNILTALWLSGMFPANTKAVLEKNEYIIDKIKFTYNTKTKILKSEIIKNKKINE
jgi:hypothetical protein